MLQIQDCYACSIIKVLFEKQTIIFNNRTVHVVFPNEPFCLLLLLGCFQKKNRTEHSEFAGSLSSQKSGALTKFLLPLSCAIFWAPKLFRPKKRRQRETFSCQLKGHPPFVNSLHFHLSFYILSCTFIFIFRLQKKSWIQEYHTVASETPQRKKSTDPHSSFYQLTRNNRYSLCSLLC